MKKTIIISMLLTFALGMMAQSTATQARKILDNTARVVGNKSGAQAHFTMTGKYGNSSGTIYVKGSKFAAHTEQGIVWYDGKNQWTLNKKAEEVTLTTPTAAQQQALNPYNFINIYKNGYKLSYKTVSGKYVVHLMAQNQKQSPKEMYITVTKSYQPTQVRMRSDKGWSTITLSNFKAKAIADSQFRFNSKDFPNAEVIDLR